MFLKAAKEQIYIALHDGSTAVWWWCHVCCIYFVGVHIASFFLITVAESCYWSGVICQLSVPKAMIGEVILSN